MASPVSVNGAADENLSAAQKLLQAHTETPHHVTIEDAPDDDLKPAGEAAEAPSWALNMSTKAAGKQKETARVALDTKSEELFPALGAPKSQANTKAPSWGRGPLAAKPNGASTNGTPTTSAPSSGIATPSSIKRGAPSVNIPGRNVESIWLESHHMTPRNQLRRPLPDIIKEINQKSRANISIGARSDQKTRFDATGPQDLAQQALKELVQQIGTKQTVNVPIPQSARAHIIGKQGSTIKSLQEQTGARIQLPKVEDNGFNADDDDDVDIIVVVEGNALSAAAARDKILKIANERAANVSTKVKGIPAEFYPFISGHVDKMQTSNGAQIRVPPHHLWASQVTTTPTAAGQRPNFQAAPEHHIQVTGGRSAVQGVKADIERLTAELREKLLLEQLEVPRGRHQFIIGRTATTPEDFYGQTGCTIIMPVDEDDDAITIIGPADRIQDAMAKAEDLAMSVQMTNVDHLKWTKKQAPGNHAAHSKNVTRYLRNRREIERLEKQYNAHINTPFSQDGALPWELYIPQESKNFTTASADIRGLFEAHPPQRFGTVSADPFFHQYIRNEVNSHVREAYGVHLVVPEASEADSPILLVFEGPDVASSAYKMPSSAPSQVEIRTFEQGLRNAEKHILDLLSQQDAITSTSIDVPLKYHEKLRRFIKKEQENRKATQIPVRASNLGTTVTLRGPTSSVTSLADKVNAFIEQEKADEKERGFTLEFDFPQKFANHLIGKGGGKIRELREKFDVEIQVQDGKVELKGPKAKAEVARSHILSLGKQLADETTERLKIDPKFHRELIGGKGSQINRLQDRYNVLIFFPRSEKPAKDDEPNADAASTNARARQAPDEVMIRGPKKGVEGAKDELMSLFLFLRDNAHTATVSFQQKQLPSLIGSGGSGMEALRQQTGAKIDIPNGRESADSVVEIQIKGTKTQVAAAKKILEEKKSVFDDTVIKTIEVDKKYHRTLIGTSGANIRAMIIAAGGSDDPRERARTIQFPKAEADGNTIKLEGRTDVVDKMIKQIQDIVTQRESQVSNTIDVPVEKHRSLIGRGGDTKRQMEKDFSVTIDIPRQGSVETGVKITGQAPDVKKAEEHILSLTKDKPVETVQVPRSMHNAISNNGQFFRKLKGDFKVTVDHAGHTPPVKVAVNPRANGGAALPLITDDAEATADAHSWNIVENVSSTEEGDIPWVLKGSPENIEKAKKAIEAALEQGQDSNVTGFLVLPDPRTYRHVIGQGGSKVNSIRKQSGCKINVPRGQEAEAIEIIGPKEGVEQAKDLILAAVRDGAHGSRTREE